LVDDMIDVIAGRGRHRTFRAGYAYGPATDLPDTNVGTFTQAPTKQRKAVGCNAPVRIQ